MSNVLLMDYLGDIQTKKYVDSKNYMQFDESWEYLMLIVEKINCELTVNSLESQIRKNDMIWCVDTENSMLKNTYEVLVRYVKWYNSLMDKPKLKKKK